jgi:hypothetical protein
MRATLLICALVTASAARADTTTPPAADAGATAAAHRERVVPARWAACVAAIEDAQRQLGADYSIVRDIDVEATDAGVSLSFADGWCMHHTSGSITVARTSAAPRAWTRRADADGYVAERRAHHLRATIRYFDRNESESEGGVGGLDAAFLAAFRPALDRCLAQTSW